MFFIIILGFFNLESVALSERSFAAAVNPAGLAFSSGAEVSFFGTKNAYSLSMLAGNLGFSWENSVTNSYYISEGVKLSNNVYAGLGYRFSKSNGNSAYAGILIRPFEFFSMGGTWRRVSGDDIFAAGIGIKPFKEYVKAYFDVEKISESYVWSTGIGIEPVEGISLFASKKENCPVKIGIQASLGNILFSAKTNTENEFQGGVVLSANQYPTILKPKKVVVLKLKGSYDEMRPEGSFFPRKATSFFDLILTLDSLSADRNVQGLFIVLRNPSFSINQIEELRSVLEKIKKTGKKIYFYSENYFIGSYLLARVGDKIFMNPSGDIFIPGLASVSMYFKEGLERIGIKPEFQRIGEYKSAAEPFIMDTMSSYNREQILAYLNTIYRYAKEGIPELDSIMAMALINGEEALKQKLVDSLIFERDIEKIIRDDFGKMVKISSTKEPGQSKINTVWAKPSSKIAYVVADGSIVEGESRDDPMPLIGGRYLGSSTIEKVFERLEKDKSVKAIVLRVNSPGGSGLASDIMWNSIHKTSRKKPVIVSMGSVAASGGYFISCPATKVIASRTTLTGSIGVLNGKFVTRGFFEKLGIHLYSVKIGKYALSFSSYEEMDKDAEEIMDKELRWFYGRFLKRIEEGRGIAPDSTDKIGQGRIWSGEDALRLGLVDENGGILDAISVARQLSKVRTADLVYYPTRKPKLPFSSSGPSLSIVSILLEGPAYLEFTKPLIMK